MARHSTLLFAYGNSGELILSADGRSSTSAGVHCSDDALKLALCGKRGACAIGGFCEGVVKRGQRAGWHWRLLDAINAITALPTNSARARADFVFNAAYVSASEYMPQDSDPGTPGVYPDGIVVLYGEVSKMRDVYLYRADMQVAISEEPADHWTWSVEPPQIRAIHPSASSPGLPFLYLHNPEVHESTTLLPPKEDEQLGASLPSIFETFARQHSTETVGGQVSGIRIDNEAARWVTR
jgi:hypothetical protein